MNCMFKPFTSKPFSLLFIFIAFMLSCNEPVKYRSLDFKAKNNIKASDFYKNISFIQLETNENCLIHDPTELKVCRDKIFVVDRFAKTPNVFVFSLAGKFIGRVSKRGGGPGEFFLPANIICNVENNRLYLTDLMKNELMAYDLDSFSFIESFKIPFYSTSVEYLDKDHLIWYVGSGQKNESPFSCHIQITDLQCNPVRSWIERDNFSIDGPYNIISNFSKTKNGVLFHHPFLNEYYHCSLADSISACMNLNIENINFPSKAYIADHKQGTAKSLGKDELIQYCDLFENDESIQLFFGVNDNKFKATYDKKMGQGFYCNTNEIIDDLGLGSVSRVKDIYNNQYVSCIFIEDLKALPSHSLLKKIIEEDDLGKNPIVMLYN